MNLVIHELGITATSVKQLITVGANHLDLYAFRPHLYKHLAPAGSLYVQLQDANGRKIKDSETIAISTISSANYFHGYVRFLIDASMRAGRSYYVELKSTAYTYGAAAFIGWCTDYDLRKYSTSGYTPGGAFDAPLDMELWTRPQITKGTF